MSVDARELLDALDARDRLNARISEMVGEFDAAGLWDVDAATSMTAWLADHGRLSRRDAAHLVSTARRTRELPVTREAWQSGALSTGQVDAIVANTAGRTALFAEHEAEVVPTLTPLSVADTTTVMQDWRRHAEAGDDPPEEKEPSNRLHLSATLDARGKLDGDFDAEGRMLAATALRLAETRDLEGEPARTPAERRADAFLDLCRFFLDNQTKKPGGRHRPHLNVILDLATQEGRFPDGTLLPRETVDRLCCDAAMHRVLTDGRSTILDLGMATRVVSAALFTALVIRDGHCRFAGCDRPATWCDGHHVRWFTRGGPTNLDNLVLLCRRHHTRLHKPGWHAKLLPDGTFEVTNPDGLVRTSHPPGTLAGSGGP